MATFVNVILSLAVSALVAFFFLPAVKRMLARGLPEDAVRSLLTFSVLVILIKGLLAGNAVAELVTRMRLGLFDLGDAFYSLTVAVLDILYNVTHVLAYIFVVAIAVYVLSPKRVEREGAVESTSEPLTRS